MNILRSNQLFSKNTTRFVYRKKNDLFEMSGFQGLYIKNGYSIKEPSFFFTNFLSKTGTFRQKAFLKKIKEDSQIKNILSDKTFDNRELEDLNSVETKRLLDIINKYTDTNVTTITELFKCKYWRAKGCQLYLTYNRADNCMDVVLIDLYHLAIPADLHVRNTTIKKEVEKNYQDKESYDYNIKNILFPNQDK